MFGVCLSTLIIIRNVSWEANDHVTLKTGWNIIKGINYILKYIKNKYNQLFHNMPHYTSSEWWFQNQLCRIPNIQTPVIYILWHIPHPLAHCYFLHFCPIVLNITNKIVLFLPLQDIIFTFKSRFGIQNMCRKCADFILWLDWKAQQT